MKKGFALLLSLIVTSILLVVGLGVSGVAFREIQLSGFGNQSEIAFYAAETGLECGLYHDKVKPDKFPDSSGFATSTFVNTNGDMASGSVDCANSTLTFDSSSCSPGTCPPDTVGFKINNPCAEVEINKVFGDIRKEDDKQAITYITSIGYNTCDDSDPRRVGRVLELELNLAAP